MLLVRTRLAPSAIHGLGVFAAEPIARGAEVWRFTPGFDLDLALRDIAAGEELTVDYALVDGILP
jgi:SET domain-containing protein